MRRHVFHIVLFLTLFGLWTWKLLEPSPVPEELEEGLEKVGLSFVAAKSLHAAGYAVLTALALTMPAPRRWRWGIVALLVVHGAGTEIGQTYVPNRTGRVWDVLIDWLGIALGILGYRRFRRASQVSGSVASRR